MKKYILFFIFIFGYCNLFSQNKKEIVEKIKNIYQNCEIYQEKGIMEATIKTQNRKQKEFVGKIQTTFSNSISNGSVKKIRFSSVEKSPVFRRDRINEILWLDNLPNKNLYNGDKNKTLIMSKKDILSYISPSSPILNYIIDDLSNDIKYQPLWFFPLEDLDILEENFENEICFKISHTFFDKPVTKENIKKDKKEIKKLAEKEVLQNPKLNEIQKQVVTDELNNYNPQPYQTKETHTYWFRKSDYLMVGSKIEADMGKEGFLSYFSIINPQINPKIDDSIFEK